MRRDERIDWNKPYPHFTTLYAIFCQSITSENKEKLGQACDKTIEFLRKTLQLKKWECYVVVRTLYKEFPMEELIEENQNLE